MFSKKTPTNLPKVYCKITIHSDYDSWIVDFYGSSSYNYNIIGKFSERFEWKWLKKINDWEYISLDDIYHFLADENFIPISETFFYRDMELKDQRYGAKNQL